MIKITIEQLNKAVEVIDDDEKYGGDEIALQKFFQQFPLNTPDDIPAVAAKIGLIDTFYSTNLRMQRMSATHLARIISDPELHFDERIEAGDTSVVDDLLQKPSSNLFSFFSKYATLHNYLIYDRDDFAIYDRSVSKDIYKYTNNPRIKSVNSAEDQYRKKRDYSGWVQLITGILEANQIDDPHAKRKLDWFIWSENKSDYFGTKR
ncbi:hypothetical protein [Oenococcus kitaharae]|uniref:Uncharacterized protein n=1 Tax=Oenococcus kitaharae DSM 17330 TaxID=1045004 RepID=G9WFC6_9LACO|nr:hypothetical protein [Oenococcus kitaharae]EHN59083.1 hypothetical protein OKIT_0980 [Oenococcus kitaharae DSM 17330]OEY82536.1 hypothetical protein NT95_06195 [Oenococcus kitaharae]OEY84150.1 hypothetical protein NV75_04625 [Oenococcus kitaharae]OEY84644.1 hypothetical protein NT96_05230 [Oenococcus kitaharae]